MATETLGFTTPITRLVPSTEPERVLVRGVNTRSALWPERWPAIALQECIDIVEAAPPEKQEEVRFQLPCQTCEKNTACLNAKRKEIGTLMYGREILTAPMASESTLFPRSLMAPLLLPTDACVPTYRKPFGVEHEWAVVQGWDVAWSEKTGGDYLVCMTGLLNLVSGRKRLLDVQRWQRLMFGQQIAMIEAKAEAFAADLVVIESDAAQKVWRQHVQQTTNVPVTEHAAGDGKTSLATGVPALLIQFENRRWEIPYQEGTYHHEEVDNFLTELAAFGWQDGKLEGVGEHDDTVMAFWHMEYGMSRFWSYRRGVEEYRRGTVPGAR